MSEVHQWINRYQAPLPGGQVISTSRPGEQIARTITEIQNVISAMQGADEDAPPLDIETLVSDLADAVETLATQVAAFTQDAGVPSNVVDGMVYQIKSGAAAWDWVRATA